MKTSTLFLGNITQIDYALVHPTRLTISGGSVNLNVEVTGNVEPVENVVVDFSTIKKKIKSLIDDQEEGFDHKLWVPDDHGDIDDFKSWYEFGISSHSNYISMFPFDDGRMVVSTPKFTLACPRNAINVCNYRSDMAANSIEEYLEEKLAIEYPDSDIKVSVSLTHAPVLPCNNLYGSETQFTYVHGLKNSTSWGCQNIAHGHKSWLLFVDEYGQVVHPTKDFYLRLYEHLNDHMFIWRDNVTYENENIVRIEYETPRGKFYLVIDKSGVKYHIIDTETTVEHLTEWFLSYFENDIKEMVKIGATKVYFSEGLVKGACVDLKERFDADTI